MKLSLLAQMADAWTSLYRHNGYIGVSDQGQLNPIWKSELSFLESC